MATPELSAGKTIFVIATVAVCLAVLWPRVFQPMSETAFTMTKPKMDDLPIDPPSRHPSGCCDVVYSYDINNQFFARLCEILVPSSEVPVAVGRKGATKQRTEDKPPPEVVKMCRDKVLELCGTDISKFLKEDPNGPKYQKALEELHAQNVTFCLRSHYEKHDKYRQLMEKMRRESKEGVGKHMRQERSPHLHPALMHPAMRERGVPIAPRMHDHFGQKPKPALPPMMGVRPPPGVRGKIPTPSPTKPQTGSMGFVMPMYTVGIVVFFIYTVMKFWKMFWKNIQSLVVLFKRSDSKAPQVMDFHMEPEYHKYVMNEEMSMSRPYLQRKELEELNSKHSPADDDRKLGEQAAGSGDEMDVLRSRLEETEATMARIMQQMGCVSEQLSWEGRPASPNAEEESGRVDVQHQEEETHAPAMQESPSVMNSEQLRDSVQSPKALDDSDLLSLIPEDTRMAVVGMETTPLFDEVPAEEPSETLQEMPLVPCNSKNSSPDINSYEMVAKMAVNTQQEVAPVNNLPSSSFIVVNASPDADRTVSPTSETDNGFKLISPDDIHVVNMILDDPVVTLDSPVSPNRDSSFENIQLLEGEGKAGHACDIKEIPASSSNKEEVQMATEPAILQPKTSDENAVHAETLVSLNDQKQSEKAIEHLGDKRMCDVRQEVAQNMQVHPKQDLPATAETPSQLPQPSKAHEIKNSPKETIKQTIVIDKDESSEEEESEEEDEEESEEEEEESEEEEVLDKRPKPQPPPPPPPSRDLSNVQSGKYDSP